MDKISPTHRRDFLFLILGVAFSQVVSTFIGYLGAKGMMEALTSIYPDFPALLYASLLFIFLGVIFYIFTHMPKDDTAKNTEGITEIKEGINNINDKLGKLIEVFKAREDEEKGIKTSLEGVDTKLDSINIRLDALEQHRKARKG